jgi:hypothetical protein
MYSLSFSLFVKIIISPDIYISSDILLLIDRFFLFIALNGLSYALLGCNVLVEKSTYSLCP